jgi:hypothetical protein
MMYTASIAVDAVIDALASFLQPFVGSAEIVRAQVNRVPMPYTPCVVLTELLQVDLETPIVQYDGDNSQLTAKGPKRIDVQIDFYGPLAGDYCAAVKSIYRTPYCADQFPSNIKPLYCGDGIQAPLITGEEQWQSRWTLTASMQYNPSVTVPQQSAIAATVDQFVQVDAIDYGIV